MIYIVCAEAGSRSNEDMDNWIVCAYCDPELAQQHARKAQMRWSRLRTATRIWADIRRDRWGDNWDEHDQSTRYITQWGNAREGTNPYDPNMRWNDSISYEVVGVPVLSAVNRLGKVD